MKYWMCRVIDRLFGVVLLIAFFNVLPGGLHANNEGEADDIEIIQLSVAEDDDEGVEIVFRLEDGLDPDSVLTVQRYHKEADVWPEVGNVVLRNLISWGEQDNYYIYEDLNIPEGSSQLYYLSVAGYGDVQTKIHETVYLQEPVFDLCKRELALSWNHYRILTHRDFALNPDAPGESTPFSHYRILLNREEFGLVAHDDASAIQTHTLDIPGPGVYEVRIEAVDHKDPEERTRFSLSNKPVKELDWPDPEKVSVENVHVNEAGEVELLIEADEQYNEFAYRVFRSEESDAGFEQVGEVRRPANNPFVFVDDFSSRDMDAGSNLWYYRVEAVLIQGVELCEEAVLTSAPESTIFLEVKDERQVEDTWEVTLGFEHEPFSASYTYDIAWWIGEEGNIEIVPSGQANSYFADLSGLLPFAGDVFFRVQGRVQGEVGNFQGEADDGESIHSNVVHVTMEPEVNVPNAFKPASKIEENQQFRPVFVGFEPEGYRLVVMDRQGVTVFSTDDFTHGWDGTAAGVALPENTYFYHFRYIDAGGESHEKKGVVYLVR